jgi:hypothetical protein
MSGSPPSFDAFFQQQRRMSSGSSSFGNPSNAYAHTPFQGDIPLTSEPSTLHRRGSNASLRSNDGRGRTLSTASSSDPLRAHGFGGVGSGSSRQDSFPYDQSTLISTAPKGQGRIQNPHPLGQSHIHDPMANAYGQQSQPQQYVANGFDNRQQWMGADQDNLPQWATMPAQPSPFSSHSTPGSGGLDVPGTASGSETYVYDQASPYSNSATTPGQSSNWESEFLSQNAGDLGGQGGWGGEMQGGGTGLTKEEQESLNVLEEM